MDEDGDGAISKVELKKAVEAASLKQADVGSIELHGTGTALGDPTEAGALMAVHGAIERPVPLTVGGAKANVGHSEAMSGQVGLLRALRGWERDGGSGNAHLRVLNPLIGERLGTGPSLLAMSTDSVVGWADPN